MKKYTVLFLLFLLITSPAWSQFTSEGFENWENGAPVNWFTSNIANIYVPVTQTSDAHSGSFAVHGETIMTQNGTGYPPLMAAGMDAAGFAVNTRPGSLTGWYKFHSDSGDAFTVSVAVIKNHQAIGSGGFFTNENTSDYKQFTANINYLNSETPDTIQIVIAISNSVIKPGASFVLDDLALGSPTSVNSELQPLKFDLAQNYPNPFNPSTNIKFSIPEDEYVKLRVFNSIGKEVAVIIDKPMTKGIYNYQFDAGDLPSGIYLYEIQAGSFLQMRKMMMLK